jgi:cyclase
MIQRTIIVAKIRPGNEEQVAKIFEESDAGDLPRLAGVRHRSLFILDDLYIHMIETEGDLANSIDGLRRHELFRDISAKLAPYIQPYNPSTWRSPQDAMARLFYRWDASGAPSPNELR